jgi:hypothetical protein
VKIQVFAELFTGIIVIGVPLYLLLRWLSGRAAKHATRTPQKFDPHKTPLKGVEVFALVFPLIAPIGSILFSFWFLSVVKSDVGVFPQWVKWIIFASVMGIAAVSYKLSQFYSQHLMRRANPHFADKTDSD